MTQKRALLTTLAFGLISTAVFAQELRVKKGVVEDAIKINDSIVDNYALFLPSTFKMTGKWPLLAVFNMKGKGREGLAKYVQAAEATGYILVGSNSISDTLTLSENIIRAKRLIDHISTILPVHKARVYTSGTGGGGRLANLVPIFLKDVEGSLSINSSMANVELLNAKNPFHFIALIDRENFNYPSLLKDENALNRLKFPNAMLVIDSPENNFNEQLKRALVYFDLSAITKGNKVMDSTLVRKSYEDDVDQIKGLIKEEKYLLANRAMAETMSAFRTLTSTDSLREAKKELKRSKEFRMMKREQDAAFFKETLLRDDFAYYLEEDVITYNFNNLGWWNYQMTQLQKYLSGENKSERRMAMRLIGYVNALIEDSIDLVNGQKPIDEEALVFLYMLKTLTDSDNFDHYLKVASIAAKNEDFGTALFYLEEALKKGFRSKEALYSVPHTALLRITPEFNALIKKYFEDARYKVNDE